MLRSQKGQATVEFALCLPFVALLIGLFVEVAALGSEQIQLFNAAREAARVAAVDPNPAAAVGAAQRAASRAVKVEIDPQPQHRIAGRALRVVLSMDHQPRVPLIGRLLSRVHLEAAATMRIEQP